MKITDFSNLSPSCSRVVAQAESGITVRDDRAESVMANLPYVVELAAMTDRYLGAIVDSLGELIEPSVAVRGRSVFYSSDGVVRITLSFRPMCSFGEDVAIGVAMVRGYVYASGRRDLRAVGRELRRRGTRGITTTMLFELERLASDSGSGSFIEGVARLRSAMTIGRKITSIKAEKYENGLWKRLYHKGL